jgi:hypothetical protein
MIASSDRLLRGRPGLRFALITVAGSWLFILSLRPGGS